MEGGSSKDWRFGDPSWRDGINEKGKKQREKIFNQAKNILGTRI